MHIRIRGLTSTTQENDLMLVVSKTSLIGEIQEMIHSKLKVEIDHQRLYYRGKQLVPEHRVTDYDIKLNDVIQLHVKVDSGETATENTENTSPNVDESQESLAATSRYFKNGDRIDVVDDDHGAWFEAKIVNIYTTKKTGEIEESDLGFQVQMDRGVQTAPFDVKFDDIRPRAFHVLPLSELKPGMVVFVNYNVEEPLTRGYWYDFEVNKVTKRGVTGTLLVGRDHTRLDSCKIKFIDEIMRIEKATLISEAAESDSRDIPMRVLPLYCNKCKDVATKKCKDCGCSVCAKKESVGHLILCDQCDAAYHLTCLQPPLPAIPSGKWYCPECKTDDTEIVRAGEKLKPSKKKMNKPSNKNGSGKDWGKGMACAGRTSICTIVNKHHYGPVPGVEVGMCWKFRLQVSEVGLHRSPIAGIHGRENDGAYSIALSGGYEDDVDNGEEFFYTGSGGRDLSGNKRVNGQSCDQTLDKMNKALALNCNVKFNDKKGGEAKDWKKGKPVRVVRNYHLRKHSKYAPVDGNRYDGIYKVVKYFPERGKSGFLVWRYLLRRDDPNPAPWETKKGGKEFPVIYPPGFEEAQAIRQMEARKKNTKRKHASSPNSITNYMTKKPKTEKYKLDNALQKLLKEDADNEKLWQECREMAVEGKQKFLSKVEELFVCVCCQEVLFEPVTLDCKHNVCKSCLKRSFSAQLYMCPWCRFELGEKYVMKPNETLGEILKKLFPGYEVGR